MVPHIQPPGFLIAATLFANLFLVVVNSQSLTTTWHAYRQDLVKALSSIKACERYYNSSRPQSARVLENNNGSSAGLSELRLWPGKVALLRLWMQLSIASTVSWLMIQETWCTISINKWKVWSHPMKKPVERNCLVLMRRWRWIPTLTFCTVHLLGALTCLLR